MSTHAIEISIRPIELSRSSLESRSDKSELHSGRLISAIATRSV